MAPQIPETMLAAQVVEERQLHLMMVTVEHSYTIANSIRQFNKPYKIHEVPTPGNDLNEHDMLVKVAVGSLCHTNGMVTKGIMGTKLPYIASHEGASMVVKVRTAVEGFKAGDRVLCSLTYHCCGEYCANSGGYLGVTVDGSFTEYEVVDGKECCMLPNNLSFQSAAPLACAGITTIALVGGGGGLGQLGVQFAKALGLKVIVIDAQDEALSLAKECGADTIIDARPGKENIAEKVKGNNGTLADATLNVSDHESAAATSAAVTKMHGVLVQISQQTNVSVPFAELIFRDIRIHGSLVSSRGECQKILKVASENEIGVKTNPFYGLKEIPKVVELAHSRTMQGKPVIIIDNETIQKEKKSGLQMV